MSNDLIIYSTPPAADVSLALDDGRTVAGVPTNANGRDDAHRLTLPAAATGQGSVLRVRIDGYQPFENRGLPALPSELTPDVPVFVLDDVHLALTPTTGGGDGGGGTDPGPTPPNPADPFGIIQWVYGGGTGKTFNLATHDGCGQFTEACALSLYTWNSPMWGHVKKNPGQNQYNGHAVDAVHCLAGSETGIWDIIKDSVSHNAEPVYNYAGPADPAIWYPPTASTAQLARWDTVRQQVIQAYRSFTSRIART